MTAAKTAGQSLAGISVVVGDRDAKGSENPRQICAHWGKKNIKTGPFARHFHSVSTAAMYRACHLSAVLKTLSVMN